MAVMISSGWMRPARHACCRHQLPTLSLHHTAAAAAAAGIYCSGYDTHLNARNGFPVFSTHIEANYVSKATDAWNVYKLTDEDRQEIMKMANDPAISECCCCCCC
jgi:hypothetical protein